VGWFRGIFRAANLRPSVGNKLLLAFSCVYLSFTLTFGVIVYFSAKTFLEASIDQRMERTLVSVRTIVETSIDNAVKNYLRLIAEQKFNSAQTIFKVDYLPRIQVIKTLTEVDVPVGVSQYIMTDEGDLLSPYGNFGTHESIWQLTDSRGQFFIQGITSRAYYLQENQTSYNHHWQDDSKTINVFSYFPPWQWVMVASARRQDLLHLINSTDFRDEVDSLKLGSGGTVEIFDQHGLQIVHSAKQFEETIRSHPLYEQIKKLGHGELDFMVRRVDQNSHSYVTTSAPFAQNELIEKHFHFDTIADLGWYIVVSANKRELLSPLRQFRTIYIIATLVLFLALIVTSSFISNRLIIKNLEQLSEGVANIGRQEFAARLNIPGEDEFSTLSQHFNSMAETLERYATDMESQVQQRTEELVQAEKLAALGGLVAGVAHEINTPIGVGVTATSHLALATEEVRSQMDKNKLTKEDFENYLTEALEATNILHSTLNRASDLIRSFKLVATDQTVQQTRVFNLSEYISEVVASLAPETKKKRLNIRIECDESLAINTDPSNIYQILNNLIMNSVIHGFAKHKDGEIHIQVSHNDQHLTILYQDNGSGISADVVDQIFDPFFTTRRGKGGTGLGLNIIHNLVVQQLQGTIKCTSQQGVEFLIQLPASLISQ